MSGIGLIVLLPLLAAAPGDNPVSRSMALPPDSTEARRALIREDPAAFRAAYDSLLAAGALEDAEVREDYRSVALACLEATGDSLLLSDFRFVAEASAETRGSWYEAVLLEETGAKRRTARDYPGSAEAFARAAETYQRIGHLRREAVAWGSLGVSLWYTEDTEGVRSAYEKALAARMRLGDPVLIGRTLNGLGSVNLRAGNYRAALDYYERARRLRETLPDRVELGSTLTYLGHVQAKLGDLESARARYLEALAILGPSAPTRALNEARGGLAEVHSLLGEHDRAVDLHRAVLEAAEAAGDLRLAASTRAQLAREAMVVGDHAAALRELGLAREVQEAEGALHDLSATMNTVGSAYLELGDLPQALAAFQDAERFGAESGNELNRAMALTNTGIAYRRMRLLDRAIAAYDSALVAMRAMEYPAGVHDVLLRKASALEEQGRREEALALCDEVVAEDVRLGLRGNLGADYGNRANTLAGLGRRAESLENYRLGLAAALEFGQRDVIWPCYLGIADCHEQAGALDSALVYNQLAIETFESQRGLGLSDRSRTAFAGRRSFVYEAQVHVLGKLADRDPEGDFAARAFAIAERGKARALLDMLAEAKVALPAGLDSTLGEERGRLERALGSARHRLRRAAETNAGPDSLRALRRELQELEQAESRFAERTRLAGHGTAVGEAGPPADIEAVRGLLHARSNAALLEFSLGDSASYLWLVTPGGLRFERLPPRGAVEEKASRLRALLARRDSDADSALVGLARDLYRLLLEPMEGELAGVSTLFVVPDGALSFVPLDVLLAADPSPMPSREDEDACSRYFAELPYALRGCHVHYAPSAGVLMALASRRRELEAGGWPMDFLGVGDPLFLSPADASGAAPARPELTPLPFTRMEVSRIAELFPVARRRALMGEEASEGALKQADLLSRFRIVHLAAHAVVDLRHPERSGIVLATPRDESEDGYLQAAEICGMEWGATLVVLSACETGYGASVRGEGILGLPRAFLVAGVPAVVASLWSVADESTAEYMTRMYREYLANGRDLGEAMSAARDALRSSGRFSRPFHWAPFTLVGPG